MKRLRGLSWAIVPLLLSSVAGAKDPVNFDAYYAAKGKSAVLPQSTGSLPSARVASRDERTLLPTFVWTEVPTTPAFAGVAISPEAAAKTHLARHAARFGVKPSAFDGASLAYVHDTGRGGLIALFHQTAGGVEIFHRDVKVLMTRALDSVALSGSVHPELGAAQKATWKKKDVDAVGVAFQDLFEVALGKNELVANKKVDSLYRYFDLKPKSAVKLSTSIRVKRVWFPLPDRLVPAYFMELIGTKGHDSKAFSYVIAADDGRLLYRENLTHAATFDYRVWADPAGDKRPADGPLADYTPHPSGTPDGSYPMSVAPSLVSIDGFNKSADPWLPAGATESNGNNIDAYTDDDAPDGFSAGDLRASVTSPGTFDRTYDLSLDPQASSDQKMAALAQLFYVTNWLHDYWYDSGFDEKGGNAQASNYGRGGAEGDVLHAEGQDGAPGKKDNANMSTPADGTSPRMQMYVWSGVNGTVSLTVNPPNQAITTDVASFGPQSYNVTGNVALADDGTAPDVNDACEPITSNVSGLIALVNRGNCSFKTKVLNAQNAGAIGVIIANNKATGAPPLGDDPNINTPITIPAMSSTQADGNAMKTALMSGPVSATLLASGGALRDGTIDSSVIAHEWGHYLHLRHVACGVPICGGESEGWADFTALQMIVRQGDNLDGTFAAAQYAIGASPDDPAYFGIRRYPYSVDMTKNPLTFKHITSGQALPGGVPVANGPAGNDNSEPHNTGEVWSQMLFEGFDAMLKQATGPNPPYTFDQARRRMADYVVGGLTLAPADPTFLEQRDAILATALAADMSDFLVLAQAFARRGAGSCAVAPPRDSTDFSGVVESFETKPTPVIVSTKVDDALASCDNDGVLDAGERGNVTVHVMNGGTAPLSGATLTLTTMTAGATFPQGAKIPVPTIAPLASADIVVEIDLDGSLATKQLLDLTVAIDAAGACNPTTTLATGTLVNYDNVPASSANDDVEAPKSLWTPGGDGADKIWSITEPSPGDHAWNGADFSSPSDTWLTSPQLDIDPNASFAMAFDQRHSFEFGMGTNWDGGVIEISTDNGASWNDASMFGMVPYEGTIGDPNNQAQNVLKNRQGFVATNPSYPMRDPIKIDFGNSLAGQKVLLRFRIGTDDAKGDVGWEIDNITFQGLSNKPFASLVDDMTACNGMPDGGTTVTTGSTMATTDASVGSSMSTNSGGTTGTGMGGANGTSSGGAVHNIDAGCGCFIAGNESSSWQLFGGLAGIAALVLRRRRSSQRA